MASKTTIRSTSDFERQVLKGPHTQNQCGAKSCVDNAMMQRNGFGDYLPQFKYSADYSLVLLAFVSLAFVTSIFCSLTMCLPNSMELVGAWCGHCARRTQRNLQKKKNSNKNEKSACNGNEKMVEAYSDGKKQVQVQKIQKGVAGTLLHLPAIQIIFIFLRTSTKIMQNFQRKRGCCIPLGPPLN